MRSCGASEEEIAAVAASWGVTDAGAGSDEGADPGEDRADDREPEEDEGPPFGVWKENWESVMFFCKLRTQWVYTSGMTCQRVGLNYAGVADAARGLNVRVPGRRYTRLFADVQVMEFAVVAEEAKRAKARAAKEAA